MEERVIDGPPGGALRRLAEVLLERRRSAAPPDATANRAVELVHSARGRKRIDSLVADLNVSSRRLERSFLTHVGMSPKLFSRPRALRPRRARSRLARPDALVAVRAGARLLGPGALHQRVQGIRRRDAGGVRGGERVTLLAGTADIGVRIGEGLLLLTAGVVIAYARSAWRRRRRNAKGAAVYERAPTSDARPGAAAVPATRSTCECCGFRTLGGPCRMGNSTRSVRSATTRPRHEG